MAYVRDEKETVEMDFPLNTVWEAVKKAVTRLGWTIETVDETTFHMQVKTKKAFLSYPTMLTVDTKAVSEKATRLTLNAETPVTTITSVLDFGKSQERINLLLQALHIELNAHKTKPEEKD